MNSSGFSKEELKSRIDKLQASINRQKLDGAVILQRVDLIYYTGAAFQGALVVPASGEAKLYVWRGHGRIGDECPLDYKAIRGMGKLTQAIKDAGFGNWKSVGFEEDVLPVAWYKRVGLGTWPDSEFKDISMAVRLQRSIKSETELIRVRESGRILNTGFESLRDIIREGVAEYEVQVRMEQVMRREGDQAAGRTRGFNAEARGVVASGPSASVDIAFDGPIGQPGRNNLAPMGAGGSNIRANEPVIVDFTAGYLGYMTDMTRTYYQSTIDSHFQDAHDFCVYIIKEMHKRLVPGAIPEELYHWSLAEAEKAGYADNFMNRGLNKVRFLAHGIGMEMDEFPVVANRFTQPLEENVVFAVEPKIIFEDGGVGVEDTVIVKAGGAEVVTPMDLNLIKVG